MKTSRTLIPANHVGSLTWVGDTLVDWSHGGARYHLDGTFEDPRIAWGFTFDAACSTPDGHFAVLYERLGTKALLLRDGKIHRELNRSYYHAHVYEYPICLWQTDIGRVLIAHCPERYDQIDIEDAEEGSRLTGGDRNPSDFFHSRLMVNSSGTRLLSAGWAWHPWSGVVYYDLGEALKNAAHLDGLQNHAPGSLHVDLAEEASASWQTPERVLLGASSEEENESEDAVSLIGEPRLHPRGVAVYDVVARKYVKSVVLDEPPGALMPIGEHHAVCFYKHPRLISLDSGKIIERWTDLDTGDQLSSILSNSRLPPLAIDAKHHRFAVFGSTGITVVQILAEN